MPFAARRIVLEYVCVECYKAFAHREAAAHHERKVHSIYSNDADTDLKRDLDLIVSEGAESTPDDTTYTVQEPRSPCKESDAVTNNNEVKHEMNLEEGTSNKHTTEGQSALEERENEEEPQAKRLRHLGNVASSGPLILDGYKYHRCGIKRRRMKFACANRNMHRPFEEPCKVVQLFYSAIHIKYRCVSRWICRAIWPRSAGANFPSTNAVRSHLLKKCSDLPTITKLLDLLEMKSMRKDTPKKRAFEIPLSNFERERGRENTFPSCQ